MRKIIFVVVVVLGTLDSITCSADIVEEPKSYIMVLENEIEFGEVELIVGEEVYPVNYDYFEGEFDEGTEIRFRIIPQKGYVVWQVTNNGETLQESDGYYFFSMDEVMEVVSISYEKIQQKDIVMEESVIETDTFNENNGNWEDDQNQEVNSISYETTVIELDTSEEETISDSEEEIVDGNSNNVGNEMEDEENLSLTVEEYDNVEDFSTTQVDDYKNEKSVKESEEPGENLQERDLQSGIVGELKPTEESESTEELEPVEEEIVNGTKGKEDSVVEPFYNKKVEGASDFGEEVIEEEPSGEIVKYFPNILLYLLAGCCMIALVRETNGNNI